MFDRVTCYGTGYIGSSWAVNFLTAGKKVTMFDLTDEFLADSKAKIEHNLGVLMNVDAIDAAKFEDCMNRLTFTTDVETAVKDADFIQESVPEKLELKQQVMELIEKYCRDDCIIASSTSGLPTTQIAKFAKHPERIIGGHPYNPVFLMPLVELMKGEKTSDETAEKARAFYLEVGKEPVVLKKEVPGFICNRLQSAIGREADDLVYRGVCTIEEVDKAVVFGLGLRWGIIGPHLVLDLAGDKGGYKGLTDHIGPAAEKWYEDLAKWTKVPEGYVDNIAVPGIEEEIRNRKPEQGNTREGLQKFRDDGLITLLKYHGKL